MRLPWIGRVLGLIGVLGAAAGAAHAESPNTRAFASEAAARAYLRQNPTGDRAKAAFLALVEFRLMRENPGLSRDQAIAVFNRQSRGPTAQKAPVIVRDSPSQPPPSLY